MLFFTHRARAFALSGASIFSALVVLASLSASARFGDVSATGPGRAQPLYLAADRSPARTSLQSLVGNTITVNSIADVVDGADGLCTLREAITAANTDTASGLAMGECVAGSGDDIITFTTSGTITLLTALPDLSTSISINGPGANLLTVQRSTAGGTPNFRIFNITSGVTVAISGLTISGGSIASNGCGILNGGSLTLVNSVVSNNTTGTGGGGIHNTGTFVLTGSTVSGNSIVTGGGGGISNAGGTVTITNSTVSSNIAPSFGGGGIYNSSGTILLTNSTISGNNANNSLGGGGISNSGSLTITNSTVTGNTTSNGFGGGGIRASGGTLNLKNTIIANNTVTSGSVGPDLNGAFNSQDYNLIGNTVGATFSGTTTHNILNQPANLGPLANNGGPTMTHALLAGSPALDAGDLCVLDNSCSPPLATALTSDQRGAGFSRSADANGDGTATVDIGAFEVQTILVTNTADSGAGSLRQAITDANVNADTNAINFQAGLTGTITLSTALPDLSTSMTINGPGASLLTVMRSTVSGTPNFRIFNVSSGVTVAISGLTISNGHLSDGSFPANNGGAIFNGGTLTLTNTTVSGNTASAGSGGGSGGIFNNGTLTLTNSTVTGNTAPNGSGGGITNNATLTVTNSTVSGNSTGGVFGGGGIYNSSGTITLTNSIVSGNSAFAGGGFFNNGFATIRLLNTTVSGNTNTGGDGAGILNNGNVTLTNATVNGNNSTGSGGAVLNNPPGNINLINSTVSGNHANASSNAGGGGIYNVGTVNLKNTIVANNTINNGTGPDLRGTFNSQDYNLIGNASGVTITGATAHNLLNQNANLGALANNGGPTQTMLPLPASPAIDAGNPANLPADTFDLNGNGNTTEPLPVDQRGFTRVVGTNFDIGAVETSYSISATAGGGQSVQIRSAFPTQLQATVKESNIVRNGISVSFTAPTSGSSGTFTGGSTTAAATTNASGIATAPVFTANGTAGGPYNVIASLSAGLPTAAFSLTNLKAVTNTAVSSSVNPSAEGQSVTFTATVTSTAGTPTGTVQFKANGINLGAPVALELSGVATFATSGLSLGTHAITADYNGDANFLTSTGSLAGGQLVGGIVQFSGALSGVDESDLRVNLIVTRTGSTTAAASVKFTTNDAAGLQNCNVFNGVASPRCDFIVQIGTVSFAAGETSKTFSVAIINDSYAEGTENFTVTISNPSGATLGAQSNTTVMIVDNESVTGPNPIDQTPFFVRQQYLDFLGREPDPPGEAAWISTINNCPPNDTTCDRTHVSSIFFRSAEFQQRGNFVYRFYPVSYGRKPDYDEFVPDLANVSGFLSDAQLEATKLAFIAEFMSRPAFVSAYNGLNNTQYVDTLLTTAGVTLASRQAMIDGLNAGTLTRAQVLRQIAESAEVGTKYFNQAYAVMEYFGYLRRQPDAFYLDWIAVLDGGGSPRTMAIGFVNSAEYRQRFGP